MSDYQRAWWTKFALNHWTIFVPMLVAVLVYAQSCLASGKPIDPRVALALVIAEVITLLRQMVSARSIQANAIPKT